MFSIDILKVLKKKLLAVLKSIPHCEKPQNQRSKMNSKVISTWIKWI